MGKTILESLIEDRARKLLQKDLINATEMEERIQQLLGYDNYVKRVTQEILNKVDEIDAIKNQEEVY